MSRRNFPLLHGSSASRFCIVLLSGIGDVVHGLPIANDLKRDNPDRSLVWVAEPAPAEVLRHHPAVDEIVVFRKGSGLSGIRQLRADLSGHRCDVTLNMQRYFKSVFPTLLSRAPVRVGLPPSKTRDGVSLFNTHHLPEQPWRHTQDLFLDYRKVLGIPEDAPVEYRITFSAEEREEQVAYFAPLDDRPLVGVVLATANRAKDWPAGRYVELVERLESDFGYRVLLIGGPSQAERDAAALIRERARAKPVFGLGDSVRRMMWMIDGVDLLISPDTGPLHIAHALEKPVIGLFGHTNPWRVGPYRHFHDLIIDRYTDIGELPDPSLYDPRNDRMPRITVVDVLDRVALARARYASRLRGMQNAPTSGSVAGISAADPTDDEGGDGATDAAGRRSSR